MVIRGSNMIRASQEIPPQPFAHAHQPSSVSLSVVSSVQHPPLLSSQFLCPSRACPTCPSPYP
eukprot:1561421-Pleurochrysis_carterae.AAC.5